MTTTTLSPEKRAELVRVAQGQPAPSQRVPMGIRVTKGPGAPAVTAPTPPKAALSAPTPRGVEELLRVAAGSDLARTRQLAEKITGLVEDLTARIEAEETQRQEWEAAEAQRRELAEAEAKLENELAEVRQKLRGAGRDSAASRGREGTDQRAKIRAWAVANGYEVAARGRISRQVTDAYAAATGSEVTR